MRSYHELGRSGLNSCDSVFLELLSLGAKAFAIMILRLFCPWIMAFCETDPWLVSSTFSGAWFADLD